MSPGFIHLHVHSEYSLVDSIVRIPSKPEYVNPAHAPHPNLLSRALQLGMPALALTDECNLFAMVKFYRAAIHVGIKPIIGCDLWVQSPTEKKPHRLTVLCQHHDGYLNLSRLITRAWQEGQSNGLAIVQEAWLGEAAHGLIALFGPSGAPAARLYSHDENAAGHVLDRYRHWFPERLYLELTRTGRDQEATWNEASLVLADRLDLPIVASNDVRFLDRDDFEAHEARVCIHQGRILQDPRRPRIYSREQYLKSPKVMAQTFADLPQVLENSVELAKRCNLEMSFGTYYLPAFPVPPDKTLKEYIADQARTGLLSHLAGYRGSPPRPEKIYQERLEQELEVISNMGFPGYFLIVADFINWAKRHAIPVGPGRGSGAGSLVAWSLGITDLDPIPYDLLFERFLNPDRVSMPDFDIDFCMDRRDEVIDYVAQQYGRDHVSQIITFGTMAAKAVIRDAGRVLGHPYGFVDGVAKLIPNVLGIHLADALGETEKASKNPNMVSSELIQRVRTEDEVRELLELGRKLEDLARNAGKHAGGVVIAPSPLTDFAPLYCEPGGTGVVTQFDKNDVETVGLVKFDFLGLRTLTILDWTVKAINQRRRLTDDPPLDLSTLPRNDPATYALFAHGDTGAVFQFESRGMRELIRRAQPDRFEDIIALAALFRPGPLGSGMDRDWVDRKHGQAEVTYPHPLLEPVLAPTYGVIVYQEQVMQIAQVLAGYSLGSADLLRRAMGKKNKAEMAKQRAMFQQGAEQRGVDAAVASSIFDLMEKFAEYGFNKSHSAAYALIAYQTAWLKVHYPAEFMAATLSSDMEKSDKIMALLIETRSLQLEIMPPDINASDYMFEAVEGKTVRYGLGAIKGVGRSVCEAISSARNAAGCFADLADFCCRIEPGKLNKRVLEALIQSGAMDSLNSNRATFFVQIPKAMRLAEQYFHDQAAGQVDIFGASNGQNSRPELSLPKVPAWDLEQRLAGERTALGFYFSGHPTQTWQSLFDQLIPCRIGEIEKTWTPPAIRNGRMPEIPWSVAGQIIEVRYRRDDLAIVTVEDATGSIETVFRHESLQAYAPLLVRDEFVLVEGGLRMSDFGLGLQAKQIHTLVQTCEQMGRLLRIELDAEPDPELPKRLAEILTPYRSGPARVVLTGYQNRHAKADLELDASWKLGVHPNLIRDLTRLPGVRRVDLRLTRAPE